MGTVKVNKELNSENEVLNILSEHGYSADQILDVREFLVNITSLKEKVDKIKNSGINISVSLDSFIFIEDTNENEKIVAHHWNCSSKEDYVKMAIAKYSEFPNMRDAYIAAAETVLAFKKGNGNQKYKFSIDLDD